MSKHEESTVNETSEQSDTNQSNDIEETEHSTPSEESAEVKQDTADASHIADEQSDTTALLAAIEQSKYTIVSEVAEVDKEEYIEIPYSRLSKIEKYKFAYTLWNDGTCQKTPNIKKLIKCLGYLIFFTQLSRKKNDKYLKADLKQMEDKLRDMYDAIFGDVFQ